MAWKKTIRKFKKLLGGKKFELLQVHNLINYEEHLETLYDLKKWTLKVHWSNYFSWL